MNKSEDRHTIFWSWPPRVEAAEKIHDRMAQSVEALVDLDPVFDTWQIFDFSIGLKNLRLNARGQAARGKSFEDVGLRGPDAPGGFMVLAAKDFDAWQGGFCLLAAGTGRLSLPGMYGVTFSANSAVCRDTSIVSFESFGSIILALGSIWQAGYAQASTREFDQQHKGERQLLAPAWITYLTSELAKEVAIPAEIDTDRLSDGGIFLIATRDRFDADNPMHRRAAERIGEALVPLSQKMRSMRAR